jgi:uncharacterized protein YegP (UPF0339 family)
MQNLPNQPTDADVLAAAEELTRLRFEVRQNRRTKQWRFCLKSGNGEVIATGEQYYNLKDCYRAIKLVTDSGQATVEVVEVKG